MNLSIKPLSPERIPDYLYFFDNITFSDHPDWSKCYCFSFHFTGIASQWTKKSNRESVIRFINAGKMSGYLAYDKATPVGWCNVNDRKNYQSLTKYYKIDQDSEERVCSIVCFLIHPDYRRKGLANMLLKQICKDYSSKNYEYIEAYPGKGTLSSEDQYNGPVDLYRNFDFEVKKEVDEYLIVRKKLSIIN
ncbi:GNAT family N-acetyltransferase [Bacteroidota bacterium]